MIESYIGTYESCVSTIISLQNRDMGVIDMKQTDRKQFLSSMLKLDILEQQYNLANTKFKEVDVEYKYLTKDYQNDSRTLKKEIETIMSELKTQEYEIQINKQNKEVAQEKYESLLSELVSFEKLHFENLTKEEMCAQRQEALLEISDLEFEVENKNKLKEYISSKLIDFKIDDIFNKKEETESKIKTLTLKIEEYMSNIKHISEQYKDPKNKEQVKENICKNESNRQKYQERLSQYQQKLDEMNTKEVLSYTKYQDNLTLITTKQEDINKELRELYQKLTDIDEEDLSKMDEVLEKKKIEAVSIYNMEKIHMMLNSETMNEHVYSIKKELESYKHNMERLVRYKIKENTLSDLFKKRKQMIK